MNKDKKLQEIIKNWKFASCPVEQKSIFWRWRKEELKLLAKYIQELIQEARGEKDKEWTNMLRKKDDKDLATIMFESMGIEVVDVIPVRKDKK